MNNPKQLICLCVFAILLPLYSFAQPIKIMTFNIRLDLAQDAENKWENRKESLADLLSFYYPGIIGIQEGLYHQVNYIDSRLEDFTYIGVGRDDGKRKGEYSAIIFDSTQFSVLTASTFWLSEHSDSVSMGWDAAYIRICTYGLFEYKPTQEKFWVFNTHFDNKGELSRENSAALILQKIESINIDDLPLIVMGDLNSFSESKPIQILKSKLNDARAVSINRPYGPEGTFTGFNPNELIVDRIDYIFITNMNVLSFVHIDDKRKDNYFISDHLPVMSTLELLAPGR